MITLIKRKRSFSIARIERVPKLVDIQLKSFFEFQYSKNLEGTKTCYAGFTRRNEFQYSKNLEGTKTCCKCQLKNVVLWPLKM